MLKKKLTVDGYLEMICQKGVPIDEIGILILAWMYHLQLCILFKNHYWCALNGADMSMSKIVLVYHGKLGFSDTRKCGETVKSEQYHFCVRKHLETIKCPVRERTPSPQPGPSKPTTPPKPSTPPKQKPARHRRPIKVDPETTPKPVVIQMSGRMQYN